jgi:NAD(P)-dependent dehydrogenase (short-subunit alcohol dehydrogenase family)
MSKFDCSTTASDVVAAFPMQVAEKACELSLPPLFRFLTTKTVVITGASTGGLGATVALALASAKPSTIVLLGRTESKVSPVIKEISKISPTTKAHFVEIDLLSLSSVRTVAVSVAALVPKIDVLLNNAGIMGTKLARTPEGVESQFAANHIGHFLLTNLLVPQLEQAKGKARVVNVSSKLYQFSPVNFSDPQFTSTPWNTWEAYGQSKTANILFSIALSRKLESKGVKSYSLHPGNIQHTGLAAGVDPESWPIVMKMFEQKKMEMPKEKTLEQGAATSVAAALDPRLDSKYTLLNSGVVDVANTTHRLCRCIPG